MDSPPAQPDDKPLAANAAQPGGDAPASPAPSTPLPPSASSAPPFVPPPARPLGAALADATGIRGPLSPSDLALFAEMLVGLVRSKMPLPEALRMIGRDAESRRLRKALENVEKEVAAGASLGDALRRGKGEFPDLFTQLLEQGVAANDLHGVLVELVREYQSQARFREQLWSQLLGPIVTAAFVFVLFVTVVVLNFPIAYAEFYETGLWSRGGPAPMPLPTRVLLGVNRALRKPPVLAGLAAGGAAALYALLRLRASRRARYSLQRLLLLLPVIGAYMRSILVARVCRLLSILVQRKLPLNLALALVRDGVANIPMQECLAQVARRVEQGGSLPEALAETKMFPPTLAQFVRGAMEHGELAQSLSRLAEMYEERSELQGTQVRLLIYVLAQVAVGLVVLGVAMVSIMPLLRG